MQINEPYLAFGAGAAILSAVAFVPYILSILKNKTRPSGASWWTWAILATVTVASSKTAGAPWHVLVLPVWLCLSQLFVAILSLKKGDNNWDLLNKLCVAGALAGTLLWIVTGEPLIALVISIIADFLASVPNWRHVGKNPDQENRLGWTLGWVSALLEILAIKIWSVAESSWAIYFFISMSVTFFLVWRPALKNLIRKI
jgi:hypothetical protein